MKILGIIIILFFFSDNLSFAEKSDGLKISEISQFDFWIGDWKIEWEDNEGNLHKGTNKVNQILNDKVIEENFSAENFHGKSLSVYDTNAGMWKQTWVDNNGAYMEFTGGMQGERMILSRSVTDKNGSKNNFRMVFYDIRTDGFTWDWEKSEDEGKSWKLMWRLNYTRL